MSTNNYSTQQNQGQNFSGSQDYKKGILASTTVVSLGTLSSRVLGFFRDIILAKFFGTADTADAFFVAFRIPNLFRDFLGEGAANSSIVPIFNEYMNKGKEEAVKLFNVVFWVSASLLTLITALGIIASPLLVSLIAPGFSNNPSKVQMTVTLTRIMFPYLILIGLTAYSAGVLNSYRSFASAAFSPSLLNIAMIVSALLSCWYLPEPVIGLAAGVIIGGILQLLVQIRPMIKVGMRFVLPKTLAHPGVKKMSRLLVPRLFGTTVYQLNVFVDTLCASLVAFVGPGGIAAIYYANRIVQFPLALISASLAVVILPAMSGFAATDNIQDLKKTLAFSLKNIIFTMVPISVFLVFFSQPLIRILFERGQFDQYSTHVTSLALSFYALGLVSYGAAKILVTAFYSLQDTKTPVWIAAICLVVNTVLNVVLMHPLKIGGIALASAIASSLNFFLLYHFLEKKVQDLKGSLGACFLKVITASCVMALSLEFVWQSTGAFDERVRFLGVGILGIAVYFTACFFLKIDEARFFLKWISKKK